MNVMSIFNYKIISKMNFLCISTFALSLVLGQNTTVPGNATSNELGNNFNKNTNTVNHSVVQITDNGVTRTFVNGKLVQ